MNLWMDGWLNEWSKLIVWKTNNLLNLKKKNKKINK